MDYLKVLASFIGVLILLKVYGQMQGRCSNTQEPPQIPSSIPLIGHLVGLFRHQVYYYEIIRNRAKGLPIVSLPILGARTYIVTAPNLVTSVQRNKCIEFEPVVASALKGVSGCSVEAEHLISADLKSGKGDQGFLRSFPKTMHRPLSPGHNLNAMNNIALENLESSMDGLAASPCTIKMVEWLRRELTVCTTNAVYGPENPFRDHKVEDAFWTFEENLMSLIINVIPWITARKGLAARKVVTDALHQYFTQEKHTKGSALIKARVEYCTAHGISFNDVAAFETGGALALTANTYPVTFWLLKHIFSCPKVLQECRIEIERAAETSVEAGIITHTIDMSTIKSSCPLLTATFQETLRYVGVGSSVREVVADTALDGKWLLKKGMKIVTPSNVLHTAKAVWGDDANEFDHHRFLKSRLSHNPVAFRAFGGGATLCPGRHFATTEILATASMFIARFDLTAIGKNWPEPNRCETKLWAQIIEPPHDFKTMVQEREELRGHVWRVKPADNASILPIVAEDNFLGAKGENSE